MQKLSILFIAVIFTGVISVPGGYAAEDLAKKFNDVLSQAQSQRDWQISAAAVYKMIQEKKQDFLIVDVRPIPPGQLGGKIEGSIPMPYYEIMKQENLKRLPKDKKLILVCVTGQTQNLPIVPLRVLGYDAYTMAFGMSSWIKGYFGANFMRNAISRANYPVVE
jgi:rhodanese-related sulfurtransferase